MGLHHFISEFLYCSLRNNRATIHDNENVRQLPAKIEILFDEEDADPILLAEDFEGIANLIDDVWLNAFRGFVKNEHLRICEQGSGDGKLLLLAAAQHAALSRQKFLNDGEESEDAIKLAIELLALSLSSKVEVLFHGQKWENLPALWDVADPAARPFIGGHARDLLAIQFDQATIRREKADDRSESGGFPNAVSSHKAANLARRNRHVYASENAAAADRC